MILKRFENIEMFEFELLSSFSNISHFISLRGEINENDNYSSFNLCDYTGDDPVNILRSRETICRMLSIDNSSLYFPRQTHNDDIAVLRSKEDLRECCVNNQYDAVITDLPGLCIGVSTADCVPVLLYDPKNNVVAAVHAGWRGMVKRIISSTVWKMKEVFSSDSENIIACIGPSISSAIFEVGDEVVDYFKAAGYETYSFRNINSGKYHIDLWKTSVDDLLSCGIRNENIQVAEICTYQNSEKLFSARKLGINSGRIANCIMINSNMGK